MKKVRQHNEPKRWPHLKGQIVQKIVLAFVYSLGLGKDEPFSVALVQQVVGRPTGQIPV